MQFFHIGRVCLGAQPRHTAGAVYHGAGDSCSFFTLGVVVQGRSPVSCFVQVWHEERGGRFLGL